MGMELRLTFNEDASNYDKLRPRYTKELFDDVISFSSLNRDKRALEIGIGTGQATLPFLETGCRVTAIEIGDKLAQFSREKFKHFKKFEVINQDFESVQLDENTYDLIYSASAFHWIPQETGLPKVYGLLKSGGVFAWFSNTPGPSSEHWNIHEALQKVYYRYRQFFGGEKPPLDQEIMKQQFKEKLLRRHKVLKQYGFADVTDQLYYGTRTLNAKDYVTLLSTYSNHRVIPDESRIPFLNEIADAIDRCGGEFTLCDTMLLCMGRKP